MYQENLENIRYLLTMLGMNGERGAADMLTLCDQLLENGSDYSREELEKTAAETGGYTQKYQAAYSQGDQKGLSNAASAGIEDHAGDVVQIYASYVFDYTCLKDEMNFQKGLGTGGRKNKHRKVCQRSCSFIMQHS